MHLGPRAAFPLPVANSCRPGLLSTQARSLSARKMMSHEKEHEARQCLASASAALSWLALSLLTISPPAVRGTNSLSCVAGLHDSPRLGHQGMRKMCAFPATHLLHI